MEIVIVAECGSGMVRTCSLKRSIFRRDNGPHHSLCPMTMMTPVAASFDYAFAIYAGELVHGYWTAPIKLGLVEWLVWVNLRRLHGRKGGSSPAAPGLRRLPLAIVPPRPSAPASAARQSSPPRRQRVDGPSRRG